MRAPRGLLFGFGFSRCQSRGAGFGKSIISAVIKGKLSVLKMKNRADRAIKQTAIMADNNNRMGVFRQIAFKPDRALKIKIVGWLIQ